MKKKLSKSIKDKKICGVCGGIADYMGMDSTIVRLIVLALILFKGAGLIIYFVAALVMPEAESNIDNMKSANINDSYESDKPHGSAPHSDEEFNSYFNK